MSKRVVGKPAGRALFAKNEKWPGSACAINACMHDAVSRVCFIIGLDACIILAIVLSTAGMTPAGTL